MTYNIFISYSTKDSETARQLHGYLAEIQGTSVFLSDFSLIIGQLSDVLVTQIIKCDLFILLSSKNSQNSNYVQQEIGVAKGNNKIIIPLLLDAEGEPNAMLQGISYLSIYDEEKRNTQMLRLYNYIFQESTQKELQQKLIISGLILGGIALLGYFLSKKGKA